ncbi:hypothetical protein [Constantimarinum furrinae]|uniref:Uncharacterized protein n=1 Tax=Constantimarinum furrinae TaxID=2562285 RepID=A0A7G8PWS8_9FLAO|nr:hypothetical protein [Constantimarinum furrinae]QNJ98794.1 hypothetical protein ALE3EI_2251 [Constantimarinum furrinae]
MKKFQISLVALFTSLFSFSQVGVGTTSPSASAMLEISSSSDGGLTYKGVMPPRVPNVSARNAIGPLPADTGLLVFVESLNCYQIWNGVGWESVHCNNDLGFTDFFQNFDLGTSWGYGSDVPMFDNGTDGFYGITTAANGGFSNITTLTNNFLGISDLDDEGNNGTSGFATITFTTLNVSAASSGVILSFNYEFFEFDNGDDAYYTLTIDGIDQPEVTLINGNTNLSLSGIISHSIPGGTSTVGLRIRIKQNGVDDFAGFDNFSVIQQ